MSLARHCLPPPPWFTRPLPAARGAPAAGPPLSAAASSSGSGSAVVCAAIPAGRAGVSCSSHSAPAQRLMARVLGTAAPVQPNAASEQRSGAPTAGGSQTPASRSSFPAALPTDDVHPSAEAQSNSAGLTPDLSGGDTATDGSNAEGGGGDADGRGGGGDGGGRGESGGAGDEPPEQPLVGSLLLLPLAAAAVLGARWALTQQQRAGAEGGAAQQESVNRSGTCSLSLADLSMFH